MPETLRLTQLSEAAGCGCKTDPARLARILADLEVPTSERVLIDMATNDDAGVVQLRDDLAIVVTADFFTPIVDDPYDFGRVAAANAISDVYAMGAKPNCGINLVGFPSRTLPMETLGDILRGGAAICKQDGVALVGGHTIDDPEPKFGMAVIGTVHPKHVIGNAGARAGDALILTKALGTGIISTALKGGEATPEAVAAITELMTTTNRAASEAMQAVGVHAATDVTGFGLLGHLREMCDGAQLGATVFADAVPTLSWAREHVEDDVIPAGTYANMSALEDSVEFASGVSATAQVLLADAQTSGGLLVALQPSRAEAYLRECRTRGVADATIIGRMDEEPGLRVLATTH